MRRYACAVPDDGRIQLAPEVLAMLAPDRKIRLSKDCNVYCLQKPDGTPIVRPMKPTKRLAFLAPRKSSKNASRKK